MFCFKSCLKGADDHELYAALNIEDTDYQSVTVDTIKKQFKKISLSLHPDKLAQRGQAATDEDKGKFLKAKEAYDVLSDPKKRKLYDELGSSGLKVFENPADLNPIDLLKNFQNNSSDRCSVVLLIAFVFACILLFPILFSLKCDGTIDDAPWTAIWTPMWIVDAGMLVTALSLFSEKSGDPDSRREDREGYENADDMESDANLMPLSEKVANLVTTVLFILIQIFVLVRLDSDSSWSYFAVFIPWFLYEIVVTAILTPSAFVTTIPRPDVSSNLSDNEEGNDDNFMHKIQKETEYFNKVFEQQAERKSVCVSLLRIWLAIFLALKADGTVDWNWGIVFLPVWLYFLLGYVQAAIIRQWANRELQGVDVTAVETGEDPDLAHAIKVRQGMQLHSVAFSQCFLAPIMPLFITIMLICRIQVSGASYSTFLIILPVFLILGCCCCAVFCGLCCVSCVDTNELEVELEKAQHMHEHEHEDVEAQDGAGGEGGGGDETYEPPATPPSPGIKSPIAKVTVAPVDVEGRGGEGGSSAVEIIQKAESVVPKRIETHIDEGLD